MLHEVSQRTLILAASAVSLTPHEVSKHEQKRTYAKTRMSNADMTSIHAGQSREVKAVQHSNRPTNQTQKLHKKDSSARGTPSSCSRVSDWSAYFGARMQSAREGVRVLRDSIYCDCDTPSCGVIPASARVCCAVF